MDWIKAKLSPVVILSAFFSIGGLVDWMKIKISSSCHILCLSIDWRIGGLDKRLNFLHLSFCLHFFAVGGLVDLMKFKTSTSCHINY